MLIVVVDEFGDVPAGELEFGPVQSYVTPLVDEFPDMVTV